MYIYQTQEVVMPIYFIVLLALLKTFAYKPTAYDPVSSQNLTTSEISTNVSRHFLIAPNLTDASRQVLMSSFQF